jgi:hypothetical protein
MALFRHLSALFATLLLAGPLTASAEEKPLTVETVVAKARAALTSDLAALDKVKTLRMEFIAYDLQDNPINETTLTLVAPSLRVQKTTEKNRNFEGIICSGRLEGWTARRADALASREIRSVPYEEFKKLQDMARDDLAFFAIPAAGVGTATYKGLAEIDGRKTHAVEYAYASGFRITRHFDFGSFALVASDQPTPKGGLQRQTVESLTKVDGIVFASKETIVVDGKKSGSVTYDHIQVNPAIPAGLFDFPSF